MGMKKDVSDIEAILRAWCPMQKEHIDVRGKFNSCTRCRYLERVRRTDWGGYVECTYLEGEPIINFERYVGRRK